MVMVEVPAPTGPLTTYVAEPADRMRRRACLLGEDAKPVVGDVGGGGERPQPSRLGTQRRASWSLQGEHLHPGSEFGGERDDLGAVMEALRDATRAELEIEDRGIGIPARDMERVFERFQRGSNAVGRIPGTGLGLSGARQIVEHHGGSIQAKSAEGEGTLVTVRLPAALDLHQNRLAGEVHP